MNTNKSPDTETLAVKESNTIATDQSLSDQMIRKAYAMYMEKEARKLAFKAPHKDKVKKQRRAANKVARQSRRGNR